MKISTRSRAVRALAAVSAALLACAELAACGHNLLTPAESTAITPTPVAATSPAPVPQGLESFYSQSIDWQPCEGGKNADPNATFTCATINVPLDYEHPDGQTIQIALKKQAAGREAIGSLFINPGGPGGSGVNLVDSASSLLSQRLRDSYDVIGFDPRGVGASTAVDCMTDAEVDADRAAADAGPNDKLTDEQVQESVTSHAEKLESQCDANTHVEGLLDHIDTISAARDLDIMRAVVGDGALSYLGYSYGTYLGATYAELFPGNVGRLVLDGAVDPTLSSGQVSLGQAAGFENALRAYVEDCQRGKNCPLSGDVDNGVKQIQALLDLTVDSPLPTNDAKRPLTYSLAESAVLSLLYDDQYWQYLTSGLAEAMNQGKGSILLALADALASRNEDGTYSSNSSEVINAINCLDYPVEGDMASWQAEAHEMEQASPTFGADLSYPELFCQVWDHKSTRERKPIHASGAAPILVIGTTGDPATPYPWAEALAEQLDSGRLLTWEGNGHTAYGRAGDCVTDAVDRYLLTGELPQEGLTCKGKN